MEGDLVGEADGFLEGELLGLLDVGDTDGVLDVGEMLGLWLGVRVCGMQRHMSGTTPLQPY